MTANSQDWAIDPDEPIPFILTPKALAALAGPAAIPAGEWACQRCGDAFYGIAPEDELCLPCRNGPSGGAQ